MQYKTALLVVAIAACRIPDEHYTRLGDGGTGDGAMRDAPLDGPPLKVLTRGYLFDFTSGIYQLDKIANGNLKLASASPTPAGGAATGAINNEGTHLYALDRTNKQIIDFAISATNGSLSQRAMTPIISCTPVSAKVHPGGKFLAVGCSTPEIVVVPIKADGSLGSPVVTGAGVNPATPVFTPNGSCLYVADLSPQSGLLIFQFNAATGAVSPNGAVSGPSVPRGLAVHPSGAFVYEAGIDMLKGYSIGAACDLTPMTANIPIGSNTQQLTLDPAGTHAFVTGTEVFVFDIAATGALTPINGNPFLATGTTMDGAIMDPAVPDRLYITGRGYSGTLVISIAPNGALAQVSSLAAGGNGVSWMQLAP
jgi:DNA-binding beta-propeller fold protein YncE